MADAIITTLQASKGKHRERMQAQVIKRNHQALPSYTVCLFSLSVSTQKSICFSVFR